MNSFEGFTHFIEYIKLAVRMPTFWLRFWQFFVIQYIVLSAFLGIAQLDLFPSPNIQFAQGQGSVELGPSIPISSGESGSGSAILEEPTPIDDRFSEPTSRGFGSVIEGQSRPIERGFGDVIVGESTPIPKSEPTATPTPMPTPTPQPTPKVVVVPAAPKEVRGNSYPQCGGTVGLEQFAPTDTILVTPIKDDQTGRIIRFEHTNLGNLGQCLRPTPTAIPTPTPKIVPEVVRVEVVKAVTPTPTPIVVTPTPTPVQIVERRVVEEVARCPAGTVATFEDSRLICISQVAMSSQINISNVNQNTNTNTQTQTITTQQPERAVVVQALQEPPPQQQVAVLRQPSPAPIPTVVRKEPAVALEDKELPRTGTPVAAFVLSGLLPLGYILKRYSFIVSGQKKNLYLPSQKCEQSSMYLWQKRVFNKEETNFKSKV